MREKGAAGAAALAALPELLREVLELNRQLLETLAAGDRAGTGDEWTTLWCSWLGPAGGLTAAFQQAQLGFWRTLLPPLRELGAAVAPAAGTREDARFRDPEWRENPLLRRLMEAYLEASRGCLELLESQPLEPALKKRLRFQARWILDALAPTNFFLTNPEALRCFLASGGRSLLKGLENLSADLERGRIALTDESAFAVGGHLAVTPGMVVYENRLFQLLQYRPLTERVRARPLLLVPPCINKYYILDLQPHNSFVRYCLTQGFQVFLISWVNPDARHRELGWDDYLEEGVVRAVAVVREICGGTAVNALGYCIGGTLLACALALLRARRRSRWVVSATFLTTLLDFSDPGELEIFLDEELLAVQEREAERLGYIPGRDLFHAFSQLKAGALIWPYVVDSYLKGLDPPPFDLLYWNCDATNLTPPLYRRLVRELYRENRLAADAFAVCGLRMRLGELKTPAYFLATLEDHLVPWRGAYAGAARFAGARRFVLARGGHVAGVVNPPGKEKSFYLLGERPGSGLGSEEWRAAAAARPGSWWEDWRRWLARRAGKWIPAPTACGSVAHPPLEPAPGRYVLRRITFTGEDGAAGRRKDAD